MGIKVKSSREFNVMLAKNGYTQGMFAMKVGLSLSHLNKVINGNKSIGAARAGKIQKELKVKFDELFIIEKEEAKNEKTN